MKRKWYLIFIILILISVYLFYINNWYKKEIKEDKMMFDLSNYSIEQIKDYSKDNDLILEIKTEHHDLIDKDKLISQSIKPGTKIKKNDHLIVVISLGKIPIEQYKANKINELGLVPIMMYHGIFDFKDEETFYTGGNVDQDGYNRTVEAFRNDLEMYYQKGYRMIRLKDYIDGNIDTEFGKSPIVLTFDDGNKNNINVLGKDEKGNLIIDPNSAVGILEYFKQKYPDFNVTATFFLNEALFNQPKYDEEIIKWLIDHNYDIGNHTKGHIDFGKVNKDIAQSSIAYIYQKLDQIILNKYVNIIALPFGSPYRKDHSIFPYILEGEYNGYKYKTESTLRVGWEPDFSPYDKRFDKTFIKRIRAWDNNGKDFDIEMCFKILKDKRYISDGDANTIVISDDSNLNKEIDNKKIIKY